MKLNTGIVVHLLRSKIIKINKLAFTLSEVLITLGIIGVVAAMTIPALMNQANDVELKNKFKKEYSVFSQAILQIQTDNGGDLTNALTNMSSAIKRIF